MEILNYIINEDQEGQRIDKYLSINIEGKSRSFIQGLIDEKKVMANDKIIKSNSKRNRVEMVFARKDGTYSGTDIIRYPFRIIHHELGIQCRFYDLRGSFATKTLRKGCEIKDISKVLGHSRVETTKNYYINCTKDNLKDVSKIFERELGLNLID